MRTRVRIGSVTGNGIVDESAIGIITGRRREAMGTIVMIEGVTLDLIMSPGIVTLVHQTGDLRSPPRDESAVRPRLETAAVRRQRKQRLASLPLTDPTS